MGNARRLGIALSSLLAGLLAAAAWALWPLVRKDDPALVEHVQRDVEFGWLLLQAATPLFALCTMTSLGAAVLAWRLLSPRRRAR